MTLIGIEEEQRDIVFAKEAEETLTRVLIVFMVPVSVTRARLEGHTCCGIKSWTSCGKVSKQAGCDLSRGRVLESIVGMLFYQEVRV